MRYSAEVQQRPLTATSERDDWHAGLAGMTDKHPAAPLVRDEKAGARRVPELGQGGGFADLQFALATAAGLIGPDIVAITTVHELQVREAGAIPLTGQDVLVDFIVTLERVLDCRPLHRPRPAAGIRCGDLTEEKIAAIPLLSAQRAGLR